MKNLEFSVRDALSHSIDGWWMVVLLAMAGGMIGWAFHFFQPAIHESTATLTVTMEFTPKSESYREDLIQYEEDLAFNSAEFIINSVPVRSQVMEEAQARGLNVTMDRLQQEFILERRLSNWDLHVRDRDPQVAAELANIWADKSLAALDTALQHAIQVDVLEEQITGLARNLYMTAPALSYEEFQTALKDYMSRILQEKRASSGLLSSMTFTLQDQATPQGSPVLYNPGLLVLSGAAIGLIVALWWTNRKKARPRG